MIGMYKSGKDSPCLTFSKLNDENGDYVYLFHLMVAFKNFIEVIDLTIESQQSRISILKASTDSPKDEDAGVEVRSLLELKQTIITILYKEESTNLKQLFSVDQPY